MQVTFLQGQEPYTKKYEKRPDGTYKGSSYPNVYLVTSHTQTVDDLATFAYLLKGHSDAGHCLLTNNLDKDLNNESRAQHQRKDESREWVVLDVDGLEDVSSPEQFIREYLPEPFHSVSYIVQYSPSQGIKPGLRCHFYFMLYDAVSADSVTQWLTWHNLTHPKLSNQVTLSKSAMSLSFPLDRVASANGRIIYISPPECVGFEDPVDRRIELVEKSYERLSFAFAAPSPVEVRSKTRETVNTLRKAAGLSAKNAKEHTIIRANGTEVLKKDLIDQGRVTSWIEDNERYMRCNINDGDSYAYFFHRDQESPLMHNFKGEPSFDIATFDPVFYRDHILPHFGTLSKDMRRPFIFRDYTTDKLWCGIRKGENIEKQPAIIGKSEKSIGDYFSEFGTAPPAIYETWDRVFNPTISTQWNPDDKVFNTWRPTEYQIITLFNTKKKFPTIEKIIRHVSGNDDESYERFINWLAYIQQTRQKAGTAWVFHGVPGTGKGLLFNNILSPIFGTDYCFQKQMRDLEDRFNGWMEQAILINIDETLAEDASFDGKTTINALKNWITEPVVSVRHMQAAAVQRDSYSSFIFTTNDFGSLPIQDGDRRINVAPRQPNKIDITDEEVAEIKNELFAFSYHLLRYQYDHKQVITTLENQAKKDLKEAARSSIDEFFQAAAEGDLAFFVEGTKEDTREYSELARFKKAVERWIGDAKAGDPSLVTVSELKAAHIVMCREKGMKDLQFKSMAAKRGYPAGRPRVGDERVRGWRIDWLEQPEVGTHLTVVRTAELEEKIKSEISGKEK